MNRRARISSFLILAASAALPVAFAQTGLINTIAGGGTGGVGIPATSAALYGPLGIRVDGQDNLYVADGHSNRVVRVDSVTGIITLIAGNGAAASSGDSGPATQASIYDPTDIAFDSSGNIFIAEMGAHKIRRVDAATGIITTVVGTGTAGFSGDGGPASSAQLNAPFGIVFDNAGNFYIADTGNSRIRRVDAATGTITTVAGNGTRGVSPDGVAATSASFTPPMGIGLDRSGALLITDYGAAKIRRVDPATAILSTIAGNGSASFTGDGVPATSAGIGNWDGPVIADPAGNLYFADASGRIRRVDAVTQIITTVAGNGSGGQGLAGGGGGGGSLPIPPPIYGDGGLATNATLDTPFSVALTSNGNLLLSDSLDCRVRRVYLPSPGPYTNITVTANMVGSQVQLIATVTPINAAGTPTGTVQFALPTGMAFSGEGTLLGSTQIGPPGVAVVQNSQFGNLAGQVAMAYYSGDSNFNGSGSPPVHITSLPTPAVTVSSSQNPVASNSPVTLTVSVSPSGPTPTGTVQIWNGSGWLPTATLVNGTAQVTTSFATPGTYSLGAIYSGDTNYARSLSTNPMLLTVQPSATSVTISSSANPSVFGSAVTFTAALSPSSATGTVQFLDGTTALGTTPITSGAATFVTSNLTAGNHSIQAVYSGDASHPTASSPVLTQVVNNPLTPTTVSLASTMNPTTSSFTVQYNAVISPHSDGSGNIPGGSVDLLDGGTVIATGQLSNGSTQIFAQLASLGDHSLTAVYRGDSNFTGSSSPVLIETVKSTPTVTLASDTNPAVAGGTVNFTASLSPANATGTITFTDQPSLSGSRVTLATVPVQNGAATFSTSSLVAGTHYILASYNGDANFIGAGSPYITQVVRAATTVTVTAPSASSVYAQAVTFTASVAPAVATGTVQFLDGTTSLGTVTLSSGAASIAVSTLTAGTHSITVAYSGDSADGGSTSAVWTQTVSKAGTTAALVSSLNPAPSGQAVTLTATISPAAATGSVQFLDGAAVLSTVALTNGTASISPSLAIGSHSLTAVYSGDGNYSGATSAAVSQVITTATATTVAANPAAPSYGQSVQLIASVTPAAASGSIQFFDGSTALGTAPLSSGAASFTVAAFTVGAHSITAAYSGDGGAYLASTSAALALTVNKAATTVAIASSLNPASFGQAVTFSASVSPSSASGTVQFLDGSASLGTAVLSGGAASVTVSALAVGSHSITAVYSGDSNNSGSTSATLTESIVKDNTSVSLQATPASSVYGQTVQLTAAVIPASASGSIQFLDGGSVLATVALSGGAASFSTAALSTGTHGITAIYSGDTNDAQGTSAAVAVTVAQAASAITLTSSLNPALTGQSVTFTATVTPAGATGTVQFLDGTSSLGTVTLSGGSASFTIVPPTAGSHTITANYTGNANYKASSATLLQTVTAALSCHVAYTVTGQWNVGFGAAISIKNTGTKAINGWTLSWMWPNDQKITQSWNSVFTQTGNAASLTNAAWNSTIAPGATVNGVGFNASYGGVNTSPAAFYINGTLCQ